MSFPKQKKGPNPATIADGYSLSDERVPVVGPELDFDYEGESEPPAPDAPKLYQSHPGEHHGDFGEVPVQMSSQVYVWVLCAALNSCNLGYDIGVNTSAGPIMQQDLSLSEIELELFFGAINLFAMVGAIFAFAISDRFGRRHAFAVSADSWVRCLGRRQRLSSHVYIAMHLTNQTSGSCNSHCLRRCDHRRVT
jgi:hypothetical protein